MSSRISSLGLIALLATSLSPAFVDAAVVDNFDTYTAGTVASGVTSGVWTGVGNTAVAPAIESNAGNLVMSLSAAAAQSATWRALPTPLADATTATLYMRVRANTNSPDVSFGLSDIVTPTSASDFSQFETQFRMIPGATAGIVDLEARNAGAFQDLVTDIAVGTWYNVWMVINSTTDTWDAYVNTGTADATAGNLVGSGLAWRNGASANSLTTFLSMAGASGNLEGSLDDIHFNAGQVLTNFTPVPPMLGDTDGDGVVEASDFNPIRDNFQKLVALRTEGDLNRDGRVEFLDFREWKTAFLSGGGSLEGIDLSSLSAVPEPTTGTLALLVAATFGAFGRRRTN
jgi:hypothetical protein